jgi:hypothetical protein
MSVCLFNKPTFAANPIRDALFGDMPLDQWPSAGCSQELFPWSAFVSAREGLAASDVPKAIECWRQVLSAPDLESRHYLQAWHFLQEHGQQPSPDISKTLLGVVVEVGMPQGLDLLAAYADHSARYYNYSGAGVVWEHPDNSLDRLIDSLLSVSTRVVARIGPWNKERPPASPAGQARLSFLTPSGLHFGQGPMSALAADPLAGSVLQAATALMQTLIAKTEK